MPIRLDSNPSARLAVTGSSSIAGREKITADRTYYVRSTGSDSKNGRTENNAFRTFQKALDEIATLDAGAEQIAIDLGAGAWGGPYEITGLPVGLTESQKTLWLIGAGKATTSIALAVHNSTQFAFQGVTLDASINGIGLNIGEHSEAIGLTDFGFSGAGYADIYAYDYGAFSADSNYSVAGNKTAHFTGDAQARYHCLSAVQVTATGTPVYSEAVFSLKHGMVVDLGSAFTSSGSVTGPKFLINGTNATIYGAAANIPGSAGLYTVNTVDLGNLAANLLNGLDTGADEAFQFAALSDFPTYNAISFNGALANNNLLGISGGASGDDTLYLQVPEFNKVQMYHGGNQMFTVDSTGVEVVGAKLTGLVNAVNDAAAAGAGVAVNSLYRNGSVVMIRVV